ncbi:hypothetical protein [uncultured Roseobacter sp.]|uniref:hypothetical protein n=1 Tax=uncultured Roseobacter sp. TaxID=114847 RepID=UPI0026247FC5|nr:hypothetical protein [uncultured Roseobacter sp.]
MARAVGYALAVGSSEAWLKLSRIAAIRLDARERAGLAYAALSTLSDEDARAVAETALTAAGYPLPPLLTPMNDARWWASIASRAECKAYALAAYEALSPAEQMAFRNHISEVEISA